MKKIPFLFLTILILLPLNALAQRISAVAPVLVDTIGGRKLVSNPARPRVVVSTNSAKFSSASSVEREVFELLNGARASRGLSALEWDDEIAKVARLHSQNMATQKFFSHRGNDGTMVDDRADDAGIRNWLSIGENIAYIRGYENPLQLAVEKWLGSPSHRRNLLSSQWRESAVGVAIANDGTYYLTQVFLVRK